MTTTTHPTADAELKFRPLEEEMPDRPARPRPSRPPHPPTAEEIQRAIDPAAFPPILTPEQAAKLLQVALNTLYKSVSEGRYREAVRRGKPLRFWRDRLIQSFFRS